jgi:hypothetical protein
MAKEQRHTPEQVIGKLRETEVELASVRDTVACFGRWVRKPE